MTALAKQTRSTLAVTILTGLLGILPATQAHAIVLNEEGHAAGAQCAANDVADNGIAVGTCSPANGNGPSVPWVSLIVGFETPLPPLVPGQSCSAGGITASGLIVGSCVDERNVGMAVTWEAAAPGDAPTELKPLQGILGILADASSSVTAHNQAGAVVGESMSGTAKATAVIWLPGSDTAVPVSTAADNCIAVDVNDDLINGRPSVALNCPSGGVFQGKVARATGLLASYVITSLPRPAGATFCTVSVINDANQALGTCHFSAPDVPVAAFWATPNSAPELLDDLQDSPLSRGKYLNNAGHAVFMYRTAQGHRGVGFWDPVADGIALISPISGGVRVRATGLANDDTVALVSENADENLQAAIWTPAGGTEAIDLFQGGKVSGLQSISPNGDWVVGVAEDGAHNTNAVYALLP